MESPPFRQVSRRVKKRPSFWRRKFGYPVVLKVHSEIVTHKTDVGGVQLNLTGEEEVRQAYRAIAESVVAKAGAERVSRRNGSADGSRRGL